MPNIFIIIVIVIIVFWIFITLKFKKKRKLLAYDYRMVSKKMKQVNAYADAEKQIVQYDKIYHNILKLIGYNGSFGEILKSNPKEINDINTVWKLHKTRNKLVHDMYTPDNKILLKEARNYKKITEQLLSKLK